MNEDLTAYSPEAGATPSYSVKLKNFEGPLDLLLYLIKKEKIDIYDIPIAGITKQYLEYIRLMEMLDLELAGEFIFMAATLLRIKTRLMLPALPNEEEDPRAQLVEMLVEYQKYQKSADTLRHREIEYSNFFPRSDFSYLDIPDRIVEAKRPSVFDLVATFKRLLDNLPVETIHEVQLPAVTVEERRQYVLEFLKDRKEVRLEEMFGEVETRIYAVVTFLAVLELVRAGSLGFSQKYLFGPVNVWLKPTA